MNKKIDYLCIGVQKSGTMSLINYLNLNPDVYCLENEQHFFDDVYSCDKNIDKFEKLFKTNKKIIGKKTPSYCYLRYAMDKIYKYNQQIKLILLLREPISRAYSQYNMILLKNNNIFPINEYMNEFNEKKNIKLENIEQNGHYFIQRGYYDEIIEYILTLFPKEQLYIGISEEIKQNPDVEYNKIYSFLGANNINIDEFKNLNTHIGKYANNIPIDLEQMLYDIYKPHNEKLYEIIGRRIESWEKYYEKFN